jgi:hypothetical protein
MAGAIGHLKKAHNTLAARIRQGEQQKGLGGGEEMTEHLVTVVESLRDLKEKVSPSSPHGSVPRFSLVFWIAILVEVS